MNKRIQELILRTDAWCEQNLPANWTDDVDQYLPLWNAKFAELIVRECIDIISPYTIRMGRPGEEYLHPIQEIKTHFGVK